MRPQQSVRNLIVRFSVVTILLLIAITIYTAHGNDFAIAQPPASSQPLVTNAYVLETEVPVSVYRYAIARIDDYLSSSGLSASSMSIDTKIVVNNPYTYTLKVTLMPQNKTFTVGVQVKNFSSILSTAVYINGQLQNPQVSTQGSGNANAIQVDNLNALTNSGVTTLQANAFVSALQKFDSSGSSTSIDTKTITHKPGSVPVTYVFMIRIGGTSYDATLRLPSLSSAQLLLVDKHNTQVFDSGVIASD